MTQDLPKEFAKLARDLVRKNHESIEATKEMTGMDRSPNREEYLPKGTVNFLDLVDKRSDKPADPKSPAR